MRPRQGTPTQEKYKERNYAPFVVPHEHSFVAVEKIEPSDGVVVTAPEMVPVLYVPIVMPVPVNTAMVGDVTAATVKT